MLSFVCKECATAFSIPDWRFKNKGKRLYCSKKCRIESMQGNKNWKWKDGRAKKIEGRVKPIYWFIALEHYQKRCNRCLSEKNLQVHHKDRNRNNNLYTNLEILCRSCHSKEHAFIDNFGDKICHGSPKSRK